MKTFEEFAKESAAACPRCKGDHYVERDGTFSVCPCQVNALLRFRFEQLPIDRTVRVRTWEDWDGYVRLREGDSLFDENGHELVVNHSWLISQVAFHYCFGDTPLAKLAAWNSGGSLESKIDREKSVSGRPGSLRIDKRISEGANLAIMGDPQSGKTFLASLIAKECVYSSVLVRDIEIMWVSRARLENAIEFKQRDQAYISSLIYQPDVLFIDGLRELPGKAAYQVPLLDDLFESRLSQGRPIIVTGHRELVEHPEKLGEGFAGFMRSERTIVLELLRSQDA